MIVSFIGQCSFGTYCDIRTMPEFCVQYINVMGEYVDGAPVDIGILPTCLGCNCDIYYKGSMFNEALVPSALGTVHVSLSGQHYDLLYLDQRQGVKLSNADAATNKGNYMC